MGLEEDGRRQEIESKLTHWWEEAFGAQKIGSDQDFFALGGDELLAKRIGAHVLEEYKVDIGFENFYDARTISRMADFVQVRQASAENWCIVPIRTDGGLRPLFLIHGVGGNVLGFFSLVKHLRTDQPVYGVQAQALQKGAPVQVTLEGMAAHYVKEIRRVQPRGPYALLGLSFGGLVAYEIARQFRAQGQEVGLLGMLDTWQPDYMKRLPNPGSLAVQVYHRVRLVWLHTRRLNPSGKLLYLRNRLKSRALRMFYRYLTPRAGAPIADSMRSVRDINLIAGLQYRVHPYEGHVTLFRATGENDWRLPHDLGWGALAKGGVKIHHLPGDHGQILAEPNVALLAELLTDCLEGAQEIAKRASNRNPENQPDEASMTLPSAN
jgi:thioesterase domain-containing protein